MTRIIALLIIAQFICLSQSAQVKRASDACPGYNNKTSTSKEYAYLSKRTSGDSDFSKPKYQSIYAKNTSANTTTKRGRAIAKEERVVKTESVHSEKKTTPEVKDKQNNSGKVNSVPIIVEDEFEPSSTSEKKAETAKPMDVIQTEKVVSPEPKSELTKEEGKMGSSKKSEKTNAKNKSTKSSDLTTTKATKQKQQKKTGIKKLRLGKKCATDCPEF